MSDAVLTFLFAVIFLWDVFSVSFWLSHQELCQKPLRWIHHCRLHWTFGLLIKLKDFLNVFFYTSLVSLWKESFDERKCIPKSTSHGSFGVNTMYSRHSYTPSLSRSPQHFHRPGERRAKNLRFFFFWTVSCFTNSCPLWPPVRGSWAGLMFSASLSSQNKDTSPSPPFCNTFLPHKQGKGGHRPSAFCPLLLFSPLLCQQTLYPKCPDGGTTVLIEWIKHTV